MKITPVILAGGSGERLWPLSQRAVPKPFLFLNGARTSLFQDTLRRVEDRHLFAAPLIVCNTQHVALVQEQLAALGMTDAWVIAEPVARNTAAALALASLHATKYHPSTPLLVLPADHSIADQPAFLRAVMQGASLAQASHMVTFAATATVADSAYGYIQYGEAMDASESSFYIHRFIEKPDKPTAHALLAAGNVGINCGILMVLPETAIAAFETHAPKILARCRAALTAGIRRKRVILPDAAPLMDCDTISIDYALMEKIDSAVVIPVSMGWADLGSFTALSQIAVTDDQGNSTHGSVVLHEGHDSYIYAHDTRVAAIGLEDMLVIATRDALLIAPKERAHELRMLQHEAQTLPLPCSSKTTAIERPWGRFYSLDQGADYQVKRLHLNPGCKISLQSHQHRSEHWVVTRGCAKVTQNDEVHFLQTNQSTYIPAGAVHRLENDGAEELVVIEVQTGNYLGEDDIIRLEDSYDRS